MELEKNGAGFKSPAVFARRLKLSAREIAERLVISEKTVGNHISKILAKPHVNDRSQRRGRSG